MSDDKTKRGKADRSRISLRQYYEVRYWSRALNVARAKLTEAVAAVGHLVKDVKKYFSEQVK